MKLPERTDVVVVGAGTAGAAAAAFAAARGARVVLLDAGPLEQAGATWINSVPAWAFDEARLARPTAPELRGVDTPSHLAIGWGAVGAVVREHAVMEVDMRAMVARLQAMARAAGADLVSGVRARAAEGGVLDTDQGKVRAELIVDASGSSGARLLRQPRCDPTDICTAAQEVRRVVDGAEAERFFESRGVPVGEGLCFTGVAGGYSVVNLRLHRDDAGYQLGILAGSIPALGQPSGRAMLDRFVGEHPWIGEAQFGGQGAIPLAPARFPIASDRTAAIGDAARQVFAAHGSGIGLGIVAARMLVDSFVDGHGVQEYVDVFRRRFGGLLHSFDSFRRLSQTLTHDELAWFFSSAVTTDEMMRAGLAQRFPRFEARLVPAQVRALLRPPNPTIGPRLVRVISRMALARTMTWTAPLARLSPALARRYELAVARVLG